MSARVLIAKKIDRLSGFAFLGGLFSSILRLFVLAPVFNLLSSVLYLAGYGLWFIATQLYPNQKHKHTQWYGFAAFKEQLSWAALLGLCATVCSILAIFASPPFAIVACCLGVISNVLWMIGEYHKTKVPPHYDKNFSLSRQQSFIEYSSCMTGLSIISAATTITGILFPAAFTPLLIFIAPIIILTVCMAINRWIDYSFGDHAVLDQGHENNAELEDEEDSNTEDSYQSICQTLNQAVNLNHKLDERIPETTIPPQTPSHELSPDSPFDDTQTLSYN